MDDFDLYRLFKTLHIIAVVLLGAGFVLEAIVGMRLRRLTTVQEVRSYAWLLCLSENYLSPAAAVAIAVFGYLTADRAGFELDVTWLALGQVLFYTIAVLAILVLRPAANRLYKLAQSEPDGPVTTKILAEIGGRAPALVGALTSVMFAAVIYLMVSKPGW